MSETKTITVPKSMPVTKRIPGVSRKISKWLESLEKPFNIERDVLHLAGYERNPKNFKYCYVVDRDIKTARKR